MSLNDLLNLWHDTPTIAPNITAWRTFPAQPAQTAPLPTQLHPLLAETLRAAGIDRLYTHQSAAWQHIQAGHHPIVVTGTASGKTLCYNLPILDHLLHDVQARALYLFPTKALTHDQATALNKLSAISHQPSAADGQVSSFPPAATYDGDTPAATRPAIRRQARIILTNPDMLHTAILPHHTKWADLFRNLRFIVIDEMHVYRGVFGSHVANVLRRLKRIAVFYGAAPQFILTSATIANPTELAERLIEHPTVLIDNDGAAKGQKQFLIYNPPIIDADLGLRRSSLLEAVRLAQDLFHHNLQTILFARTRRTVELLLTTLKDTILTTPPPPTNHPSSSQSPSLQSPIPNPQSPITNYQSPNLQSPISNLPSPIRAYRSGYLPRQRRDIEQGLRSGDVKTVVATSALELGIDIGQMSAAVLVGYPGTIAGTWQQAGRAGRQDEPSVAILITSANPLDQFLAHHPDYFFERTPEQALIDPDNLLILLQHLRCAAFELPFPANEPFGRVASDVLAEFLAYLHQSGELHHSHDQYYWMAEHYPAQQVSLRTASPSRVTLQAGDEDDTWATIGEVDVASADWMVHPDAIYLHEGQSFLVETLDLEQNVARLRPVRVDYYTEPLRETTVQLIDRIDHAPATGATKSHGEILVTTQVIGYRMLSWFHHERLGEDEVTLPPSELQTSGYWLTLAPETVQALRDAGLWSNDPNNYGPNWPRQRNQARARDGYRCQLCGLPEQDHQHDVHHKIPFRQFDSYETANRLSNLVTLCRTCHRRAETAVRTRSGLSGLADALGHLAPLFLMCDSHDLGLHADPQSPLAEGQPTIIIFERVPAGLGFSRRLFDLHTDLLHHAYDLVATCPCADGCPSCVGPAGEEGMGGKRETLAILEIVGQRS